VDGPLPHQNRPLMSSHAGDSRNQGGSRPLPLEVDLAPEQTNSSQTGRARFCHSVEVSHAGHKPAETPAFPPRVHRRSNAPLLLLVTVKPVTAGDSAACIGMQRH
jgi:hypothetical protein